jgi:MFS family permease
MRHVSGLARWWGAVPPGVRVVLAADLLSNIGSGLVVAFTAVYVARVHHHGPTAGALAVAAVAAGCVPSNALAGRAADRRGSLVVLAGGWVVAAVGDLALVAASGTLALLAACVLVGVGVGAAYPALNALLGQLTDGEVRRTVFGAHHGLVNAGFSLGALGAAAIVAQGTLARFQFLYLLDALSFLTAAALLVIAVQGPRLAGRVAPAGVAEPGTYRQVLADRSFRRLCLIAGLLVVFGFSQFHAALPLVLSRPGRLCPGAIALVFAANTLTVTCAALPVAVATKRAPRMTLVAAGSLLFAASWGLLAISGHIDRGSAQVVCAAAAAVMGLGETLLSPALGPLVNELAPEALRGRYNAVDSLVLSCGTLAGPVLGGVLLSEAGASGLLAVLVGGCLMAALGVCVCQGRRSLRPAAEPRLSPLAQPG